MKTTDQQQTGAPSDRVGFVYFGNEWFAENRTSSHHIARRLASRVNLLYVDSPGMRAPRGSRRDLKRIWNKLAQALRPAQYVEPGLWLCTIPQLPWRGLPGIQWLNHRFGSWALKRAMRLASIQRPVLWFVAPHPAFMLDRIDHDVAIYYCVDDHAAHPGVDVKRMQAFDLMLTQRASHVFVAPPTLVEAKRRVNPATTFSPHGVDVQMFAQAQAEATIVPPVAAALGHPVIGYFGLIAPWTDIELIEWVAQQRPDWQFLLVGLSSTDVTGLKRLKNVTFVGQQPYESLPRWAKAFDVAIIPYRQNQQVQNANPLKLREYLATGKPVVAVPTAEVEKFRDVLEIEPEREGFLAAIERSLATDSPDRRSARMAAVRDMSWDHRVDETLKIVNGLLVRANARTVIR